MLYKLIVQFEVFIIITMPLMMIFRNIFILPEHDSNLNFSFCYEIEKSSYNLLVFA